MEALRLYGERLKKDVYVAVQSLRYIAPFLQKTTNLPMDYIQSQIVFLQSLSRDELMTLQSYTKYGDRVINGVIRGTSIPTDVDRISGKQGLIVDYVREFVRIVSKAPALSSPLEVYRGQESPIDTQIDRYDFVSTSRNSETATIFGHYVNYITLQAGVRTLWIELVSFTPSESEILVVSPLRMKRGQQINGHDFYVNGIPRKKGSARR